MGSCPVQNRTYRNPAKELRLFISSATERSEVDGGTRSVESVLSFRRMPESILLCIFYILIFSLCPSVAII
jgi:hypothetical protein